MSKNEKEVKQETVATTVEKNKKQNSVKAPNRKDFINRKLKVLNQKNGAKFENNAARVINNNKEVR